VVLVLGVVDLACDFRDRRARSSTNGFMFAVLEAAAASEDSVA
jgi:hypothetical protein